MRKVTVLYDGSSFTFKWVKTLFWVRDQLRDMGYAVSFPNLDWALPKREKSINDILAIVNREDLDIVCMAFHHSTSEIGRSDAATRGAVLKKLRENCNRLIWFDTADSTGTCLFDVLPYVDRYLKKQILRDLDAYKRPIWGGRIFCEYLHEKLGINDEQLENDKYDILPDEYKGKLGLSWNMGVSDFRDWKYSFLFLNHLNNLPKDKIPFEKKRLDTYFNGTVNESVTGWQRKKCQSLLMNKAGINCGEVSYRVSRELYQHEIRDTKSIISPFGWGEICFRDFEAFQFHSLLIKPSLRHLETWPSFFKENETYVPIDWELEELYAVLDKINAPLYKEIAINGYDLYRYYRSKDAKLEFAQHILKNILA